MARTKPQDVVLIAEERGQLAGFIAVWPEARRSYIDNLHVDPGQRGRPTGRAFDRFLRSQAPCQRMSWRRFERLAF
mgnify:FL=1|jgi:hypothetical protein